MFIDNKSSNLILGDFVPQNPYRGSAPGPRWVRSAPYPYLVLIPPANSSPPDFGSLD